MDQTSEQLRIYLRELLQQHNVDATTLSREIGRSKDYIRDFIEGRKQSISYHSLSEIEKRFQSSASQRFDGLMDKVKIDEEKISSYIEQIEDAGIIGIFPTRHSMVDPGQIAIGSLSVESMARPSFLPRVGHPYGIIVETEAMLPIYEPGDILLINPALGMRKNTDVIALSEDFPGNAKTLTFQRAVLGKLESFDAKHLTISVRSPEIKYVLERDEWPTVSRVASRIHKR